MLNTCFLDALSGKSTTYAPLWMMRQAGRYLPEYIQTRKTAGSFMGLATSPQLATEVTLQPLQRYNLDAAILFSDILTIPDAMGLGLSFITGEGPKFSHPLRNEQDILHLQIADMNKLKYVFDAVSSITKALRYNIHEPNTQSLPLIGFSGSPFTLACYMVEGSGSSNNFEHTRSFLYKQPQLFKRILDINTQSVIAYLSEQINAGVNAIMLFDTWGGLLSAHNYEEYSLNYMQKIISALRDKFTNIPSIIFTKGGGLWLDKISSIASQPNAIGIDWTMSLAQARKTIPSNIGIQGNLDPIVLRGSAESIITHTKQMLDDYYSVNQNLNGYIANLGHGISQHTDPECVKIFTQTVKEYSKRLLLI